MRLGPGLSKGLSVEAILGPACRFFIANQFIDTNDHHGLIPVGRRNSMLPSFRKFNAIDAGDDVDSIGGEAHLENDAWSGKVLKSQIQEWCTEFIESIPNLLGIVWICFNPDIEIFGESRRAVNRKCITTDDEEFSLRGVQCDKQISEVGVHAHRSGSK